jgi:hypothetical protein
VLVAAGIVREGAAAARRNTTNTEPYGSRWSGTAVRPSAIEYAAGSIAPVTGFQISASFASTRKLAWRSSGRSFWLATK